MCGLFSLVNWAMSKVTRLGGAEKITRRSKSPSLYRQFLKAMKARGERRRAKQSPDCVHGYGRYNGWD